MQVQQQHNQPSLRESLIPAADEVILSYGTQMAETYDITMNMTTGQTDGFEMLRGLVMNLFQEQGLEMRLPTSDEPIDLESISQAEAIELVADDGYFGIVQTSDRIVEFAIGIAGGDPARIDAVKAGVERGFNEAREAFSGELPEISYSTYNAVMDKLDAWAGENSATQHPTKGECNEC